MQLYRRTCSDLNRARSYTANPELLGYLNQLTGRAYRFIYRAAHETPVMPAFARLVTSEIPAAFRRERLAIAIAAAAFLLGTLFGALAVAVDPANGPRLIPREFFTESPRERVAQDRERDDERIDTLEKALVVRRVALHAQHPGGVPRLLPRRADDRRRHSGCSSTTA